jgi:DNA-3-methyladenine glycosylase I
MTSQLHRCWNTTEPLYVKYHDEEWGVPVHDDRKLFEFLVLDAFQAGLSWWLILKRREVFREAFDGFDPAKVAKYESADLERLLCTLGMIKNKAKIAAAVTNAQCFLSVQQEYGSFDRYIWQFVGGKTITNSFRSLSELPAESTESKAMSGDLRKRGFKFVGPTICYAFMQAAGLVNDHLLDCFRHSQV